MLMCFCFVLKLRHQMHATSSLPRSRRSGTCKGDTRKDVSSRLWLSSRPSHPLLHHAKYGLPIWSSSGRKSIPVTPQNTSGKTSGSTPQHTSGKTWTIPQNTSDGKTLAIPQNISGKTSENFPQNTSGKTSATPQNTSGKTSEIPSMIGRPLK